MDVTVVGAGVIGLSAAVRLQEAGAEVRVVTREMPHDTTSNVAAAIWYPYRAAPEGRVLGWGRRTFEVFDGLARLPATGVRMREARELFRHEVPDPWWMAAVPDLRRCTRVERPAAYRDGFVFTTPVVEMPIYLTYLLDRFQTAGGLVEQRSATSMDDAAGGASVVVNCAGLGARELATDDSLTPIRGQVVRVANPGLEEVLLDEGDPEGVTYIVPRSADCVLGGTADEGLSVIEPDPVTARDILRRCVVLEPRLRGARVLGHQVGLRPGRPEVRLEPQVLPSGRACVHNYGHGGAGVTLSWGCADDVTELVRTTV
ncbi:MAG: FAD-dependent oxidoreductase [Jiangellaceae bacterium]